MTKLITLDEVKKHNSDKSVWMVIHNDIYDVTKFLDEHPGGPESLLDVAGQDGTQPFEDVGHSEDARELMKKYKIGTLPLSERTKSVENCRHVAPPKSEYKAPSTPKVERRVQTIVVPRERHRRRPPAPPPPSSNLKYAILALAGAIIIGVAIKKYMG